MKVNFLTYANYPNPLGIPAAWPALGLPVDDTAPAPAAPWQQLSKSDYDAYVSANQSAYDAWAAAQASAKATNLATLSSQYDSAMTSMQSAQANWATLTAGQKDTLLQTHNSILIKILPFLKSMYIASIQ